MQDFISFACDQFKISKKELLSPLRAVRVMYPRAVMGLIIGHPSYMGLGCSAMGRKLQRNYSVYFRYLKTFDRYKDVCDDIWAIWLGRKSNRSKFFEFEPEGKKEVVLYNLYGHH